MFYTEVKFEEKEGRSFFALLGLLVNNNFFAESIARAWRSMLGEDQGGSTSSEAVRTLAVAGQFHFAKFSYTVS